MQYSRMVTVVDDTVQNQAVRLVDMTVARPFIIGIRFQNCLILGPAVVVMLNGGGFQDCVFDAPPEQLLWDFPTETTKIGAIGLTNCSFKGCRFEGIGFAGPPDFAEQFIAGLSTPVEGEG